MHHRLHSLATTGVRAHTSLFRIASLHSCPSPFAARSYYNVSTGAPISLDDIVTVPLVSEVISANSVQSEQAPLVILHGLFGSKANNRTMAKLLNTQLGRDVYSLDLRNHGSSPHTDRHDYPSMAADVVAWLKTQLKSKPPPMLIGHSMGAKVAMSVALHEPSLCSSLVCLENAPITTQPLTEFNMYLKKLEQIVALPSCTYEQALESLSEVASELKLRQFLMTLLQRYRDANTGNDRYRARINMTALKDSVVKGHISAWPFQSGTLRWTGPSLFIRCSDSTYVPDESFAEIGSFFPNFEVRDIEGGHWINADKPKECTEYIVDFLARKFEGTY